MDNARQKPETDSLVVGLSVAPTSSAAPEKKSKKKIIGAVLVIVGLTLSLAGFVLLTQTRQNTSGFARTGAVCGNRIVESGEQCDDGNTVSGDGCDSVCQLELAPLAPAKTAAAIIKTYRVDGEITDSAAWHELSASESAALSAGDIIYITAQNADGGSTAQTHARIRVTLGTDTPVAFSSLNEVTSKKPKINSGDPDEFYLIYTLPRETHGYDLHIDAQMFTPGV